ncbi:MAG: hypothetical protein V2I97_16860 [Desulfococcaceae bacterium]|jgi:cell division protein FtsW (lipid II flippase)|nr:hypothetical protein [Desulfococcaceae bacterium]
MNTVTDNSRSWLLPIILLLFFLMAGIALFRSAPQVKIPEKIEINAGTEPEEFILGRRELGQSRGPRSAEDKHLKISFIPGKPKNKWEIYNIAKHRRVDVQTDEHPTLFLKRWELQKGDRIFPGDAEIEVLQTDSILELKEGDRILKWEAGKLHFYPQDEIYSEEGWSRWKLLKLRVRAFLMENYDRWKNQEIRLFSLGGGLNRPDSWKLSGAPMPESLRVYQYRGKFRIGPGSTDTPVHMERNRQAVHPPPAPPSREGSLKATALPSRGGGFIFSQMPLNLKGEKGKVERLILGRTYYKIETGEHSLQLIPGRNRDVQPWEADSDPEIRFGNIRLQYNKEPVYIGAGKSFFPAVPLKYILFILCMGTGITALLYPREKAMQRFRRDSHNFMMLRLTVLLSALLLIPFSYLLWLIRGECSLSFLMLMTWISWAWASFVLLYTGHISGSSGRLWNAALFLAGAGSLILVQLALGADNTRWAEYARKHAITLSAFAWAMPLFAVISVQKIMDLWTAFSAGRTWKCASVRFLLCLAGIILLLLQLGFGGEQGIFEMQPAEMGKILLVFTAAFTGMHLSELRRMNSQEFKANPAPLIFAFLLSLLLIGLALITVLVGVQDISPILIMGIFMLSWLWDIAPHPWKDKKEENPEKSDSGKTLTFRAVRGFVVFLILGTVLTAWGIYKNPHRLTEGFPHKERFKVWAQPQIHPHTGEQVIRAMKYAGQGGWLGSPPAFCGENGTVMNLPMVQNDFIGAFVLYKFGGLAGILLLLVQAAYVLTLFECAGQIRIWRENVRDHERRKAGMVLELTLRGLTWMHITHWIIAWSNALGLLPVMGQPMTWISAANSHLICFGLPTLVLGMMAGGEH